MKRSENLNATLFYMIGNLFDKAIALITVPIFTRIMSAADYGIFNTYASWVSIFAIFIGLSLGQTLRSAVYEKEIEIESYISSIFGLSILDFVLTFCLVIILSFFFDFQITRFMLALCLIQSFLQFIRDTIAMKYMMQMRYVARTLILSIPNILVQLLAIAIILNMADEKYMGKAYSYVIVYLIVGVWLIVVQYHKSKDYSNYKYWKYGLTLSLPLVLHSLSCVVLSSSDRIMITMYVGTTETGIYSLVYNMTLMTTVITTSFENVWIPWFSKHLNNNDRDSINQAVVSYIMCVALIVCAIIYVSPEMMDILAPKEYAPGKSMAPLLMTAVFVTFLYTISVNLEYYRKATKNIAKNTCMAAMLNVILNMIFIPKYGAIAAAATTLLSYIIALIMHYRDGKKLEPELFPIRIYCVPVTIVIVCSISYYFITDYIYVRWSLALFILLFLFIAFVRGKLIFLK